MIREYKISKRNSTVNGYPSRGFDWSQFCWDGSQGEGDLQAPLPWTDDGFIGPNCEYLHVPYAWVEQGTIYRVRPNESMRAGQVYRGHLIKRQTAVKKANGWYWRLKQVQRV